MSHYVKRTEPALMILLYGQIFMRSDWCGDGGTACTAHMHTHIHCGG